MFNVRRYEIRVILLGRRLLPEDKCLVGLDLTTGHGIQQADAILSEMFARIVVAAKIHRKDVKHCRVEVLDEETQTIVWNFYPPIEE